MKTGTTIAIGVALTALIITCAGGCGAMSAYNTVNSAENGVVAQYRQNQNSFDTMWKTISQLAQVAETERDTFREALVESIEARYEGKDPAMLWIQEQAGVQPGTELYVKLATAIEANRDQFEAEQKKLLDKQRAYKDQLTNMPAALFVRGGMIPVLPFPREQAGELAPRSDLDGDGYLTALDYDIVTSGRTKQVFETGEDNDVDVFGSSK